MDKSSPLIAMVGGAAVIAAVIGALDGDRLPDTTKPDPSISLQVAARGEPLAGYVSADSLVRLFIAGDSTPTLPCRARNASCPTGHVLNTYDVDALIALVPDPLDTHLDWLYDAQLESLRRAFERDGYVLDRFWTPWLVEASTAPGALGHRDSVPGAMVFRDRTVAESSRVRVRVLLLVGESPAGGISTRALIRALRDRDALLSDKAVTGPQKKNLPNPAPRPAEGRMATNHDTVRIVGPTFSASLGSLRRALAVWNDTTRFVRVVTGSAMRRHDAALMEGSRHLAFQATAHPEDVLDSAALTVVGQRLNVHADRIAVLEETATAPNGVETSRGAGGLLHVILPINLAMLRGNQAASASDASRRTDEVTLNLADTSRPREAPAPLSNLGNPLSDVVLDQLVRVLERNEIRAVGMRFTDVRDQLFLAQKIRARLHDVQLFTLGANALYLRSDLRASLTGMLTFSTYPPLGQGRAWTPGPRDRMLFSDDAAEGAHNALLLQLGRPALLMDYGVRRGGGIGDIGRPPVWVSAVSANGFVPVSAMEVPASAEWAMVSTDRARSAPGAGEEALGSGTLDAMFLVGLAVAALALHTCAGFRRRNFRILREVLRVRDRRDALGPAGMRVARTPRGLVAREYRDRSVPRRFRDMRLPFARLQRSPRMWVWTTVDPRTRATAPARDAGFGPAASAGALLPQEASPAIPLVSRWSRALRRWLAERGDAPTYRIDLELEQSVRMAGLLMQRELYALLRLIAMAAAVLPPATLFVLSRWPSVRWSFAPIAGVALLWAIAAGGCVWLGTRVFVNYFREARSWALRRGCVGTVAGRLWLMEVVGRIVLLVIGCAYYALTVWYCMDMIRLWRDDRLLFSLLLHRAVRLDSGLSPLVPLAVAAVGCLAWGTWHAARVAGLGCVTTFEAAMLRRAASLRHRRPDGRWARRPAQPRSLAERVEQVRDELFLLVPREVTLLLVAALVLVCAGLSARRGPTLESALVAQRGSPAGVVWGRTAILVTAALAVVWAFPRRVRSYVAGLGAAALIVSISRGWLSTLITTPTAASAFDLLFGFALVAILVTTAWSVCRLTTVWGSLRQVLRSLEGTFLRTAFTRVPERIGRIMHLTVIGDAPVQDLDAAQRAQWARLREILRNDTAGEIRGGLVDGTVPAASPGSGNALADQLEVEVQSAAWISRFGYTQGERAAARFDVIEQALERIWSREPAAVRAARVLSGGESDDVTAGRYDGTAGEWKRQAEDLVALQVVDYIRGVLQMLHKLAVFLFTSLLVSTLLLSCYPFPGRSAVKLVLMAVMLVTVVSLLMVMVQINRDEILSRISGTKVGEINWDSSFVLNAALVGVVPLLGLVTSEFPAARQVIASILSPLLRGFSA